MTRLHITHKTRRESLRATVQSCMEKQELTVTGMGRGIAENTKEKHRIKRADRLLSNRWLQIERPLAYGALIKLLISHLPRPVIHIDWSGKLCTDIISKELRVERQVKRVLEITIGVITLDLTLSY